MNAAHWHLLVNHVSIFGVLFGSCALMWAIIRKSPDMRLGATALFLVSALFAWIANETGEGAEEIVEHLPGVIEGLIHQHEEAAEVANVSVIVLGVSVVLMEGIHRFKAQWFRLAQLGVLVMALISFGLLAYTATLGGEIRHTEMRAPEVIENN